MHDFIELFAGIGHPRVAFAGRLRCVYAVDFSEAKATVYRENFGGDELVVKDIRDVVEGELPKSFLKWVSAPCPDFSSAGLGLGLEGESGALIFQAIRLLHAGLRQGTAPDVVVMENVEGLVTTDGGAVFVALITALVSASYVVGAVMLDAADFLPQSRPRVFIVAVRRHIAIPQVLVSPNPIPRLHSAAIVRAVAGLRDLEKEHCVWWHLPVPPPREKNLIDIVEPLDSENLRWREAENVEALLKMLGEQDRIRLDEAIASGVEVYGTVSNKPRPGGGRYLSLRTDGTAGCQMRKTDLRYQQLCRIQGSHVGIRPATRLELARNMGLPDDFRLPVSVSGTAKACGDGVVVPVIEWLLTHLLEPLLAAVDASTKEKHIMAQAASSARPRVTRKKTKQAAPAQPLAHAYATVAFPADEFARVSHYAAEAGVSLHEFLLRGMDRNLAEFGAAPVRRTTPAATTAPGADTAGGDKSEESDIAIVAAHGGWVSMFDPSAVWGVGKWRRAEPTRPAFLAREGVASGSRRSHRRYVRFARSQQHVHWWVGGVSENGCRPRKLRKL